MKIREAREEDLEAVALLLVQTQDAHVQAYPERYIPISLTDAIDSIHARLGIDAFWVAIDNDTVTGYVIVEYIQTKGSKILRDREYCYLQQIGVAQPSQKQGIGRMLVEHVRTKCAERGIRDIELDVFAFNSNARQFFENCGFISYASKMRLSNSP